MLTSITFLMGLLAAQATLATDVAIIDSGTDYKHTDLVQQFWKNPIDIPNGSDDDGNGYVDDTYGWNFADGNNEVIDYKYLGTFSQDVYKFFEVQGRILTGQATREDKEWYKSKRNDQEFIKELMKFANFTHGTHVAGISAAKSEENMIQAIKLIPTEAPGSNSGGLDLGPKERQQLAELLIEEGGKNAIIIKFMLQLLAKRQEKTFTEIGEYVQSIGPRVANGSFGTGPAQARMIITALYKQFMDREPTEEEVRQHSKEFLGAVTEASKTMVDASPKTLFTFAAGNDANNNDEIPTAPANVDAPNSITVAATWDNREMASFSSYGQQRVHVAAPGVLIESSIPGDEYLRMSGTSQAAPYVAGVAAEILNINPNLSAKEVKGILMQTVDKKSYLQGKIASAGVVNDKRAYEAARLSFRHDVKQAIESARFSVADRPEAKTGLSMPANGHEFVRPLPSTFQF